MSLWIQMHKRATGNFHSHPECPHHTSYHFQELSCLLISHQSGSLPHLISDSLQCVFLKEAFPVAPSKVDCNLFSLLTLFSCL